MSTTLGLEASVGVLDAAAECAAEAHAALFKRRIEHDPTVTAKDLTLTLRAYLKVDNARNIARRKLVKRQRSKQENVCGT